MTEFQMPQKNEQLPAAYYTREQLNTLDKQEVIELYLRLQERASHPQERDELTGLLTKGAFTKRLSAAITALNFARRAEDPAAIIIEFYDLKKFKEINDVYGHRVGDEALIAAAQAIAAAHREEDECSRYGGDEFIAFATVPSTQEAERIAAEIRHRADDNLSTLNSERQADDAPPVHMNVGSIIIYPGTVMDAAEVLEWADAAMYYEKDRHGTELGLGARAARTALSPGDAS